MLYPSAKPRSGVSMSADSFGAGGSDAQQSLQSFWPRVMEEIRNLTVKDFRVQELPLARIKKIMKLDEDVKMISAEAPVLFAKAAQIFITELTLRAWIHTEDNKRRTLQRNDIAMAITKFDQFDFLIDIVPRDELKPPKRQNHHQYTTIASNLQQNHHQYTTIASNLQQNHHQYTTIASNLQQNHHQYTTIASNLQQNHHQYTTIASNLQQSHQYPIALLLQQAALVWLRCHSSTARVRLELLLLLPQSPHSHRAEQGRSLHAAVPPQSPSRAGEVTTCRSPPTVTEQSRGGHYMPQSPHSHRAEQGRSLHAAVPPQSPSRAGEVTTCRSPPTVTEQSRGGHYMPQSPHSHRAEQGRCLPVLQGTTMQQLQQVQVAQSQGTPITGAPMTMQVGDQQVQIVQASSQGQTQTVQSGQTMQVMQQIITNTAEIQQIPVQLNTGQLQYIRLAQPVSGTQVVQGQIQTLGNTQQVQITQTEQGQQQFNQFTDGQQLYQIQQVTMPAGQDLSQPMFIQSTNQTADGQVTTQVSAD
ncbi:unnamed protein product [Coregonus sp. 'balchen']|nr:unnamed protein product [Coregonus sp. 'balchen']